MVQMKRELAQLLDSGQDRTARIRVEHLIREEKMVAAYELIEIYCELIAARLPIIESQKNCPIDLKEAIASVIFASPRCSDIPELTDVKKHFTAKYGKEFITAALELRPNSGVGRMVVEKLSATAPDVQIKSKVLNAIAEEHNIKWDSKSFEEKESKPAEDLLNGPSSFENAGEMHAVSKIQVPNVQATSSYDKSVTNTAINPDLRSSGSWAERMEYRQSFGEDDAYLDRKHWDIEFKDATSAAHAAAEAAERASMAARAAAELSSREDITRRYSTESENLNRHNSRQGYHAAGNGEDLNRYAQEEDRRSSQSSSRSYSKASINDDKFVNSMQNPGRYSENVPYKETTRAKKDLLSPNNDLNKQSFEGKTERVSGWQDDFDTEKVDQFGGANMGRQHNSSSSLSRSSTDDEIHKAIDHSNSKYTATNDPYVENYQESVHNGVKMMGSYNDILAAFDEYESNDVNHEFDAGPKYDGESASYAPSPERTSATFSRTSIDTWNPRRDAFNSPEPLKSQSRFSAQNVFSSRFPESPAKSVNSTESDKVPVTYNMDTPKFDSEDEFDNFTYDEKDDSRIYSPEQKVFSQYPEPAKVEPQGSTGSLAFKEIHIHEDDVHATGSVNTLKDDSLATQNSMMGANELSFGTLTGGFRNKGYMHPPYKKLSGDASSLPTEMAEQNSSRNSSRSKLINTAKEKSSFSVLTTRSDSDVDADDAVDEVIQKDASIRKAPQSQKVTKSNFMPPVASYFDDDEDSTEDVPEKTFLSRDHLVSGASRRTKDSNARQTSSSNYIPESVASANPHSHNERKPNSSKYDASTSIELRYQKSMTSSHTGREKQPGATEQATSKATPISKTSAREENFKPSAAGQSTSPYRHTKAKDNLENVQIPTVKAEPPKKEEPPKRASHVHPKLPDYQSLAAHMQSLRSNRH